LLYGTTGEFLDYFGLKDLTELPRPEELRALVAAREPEQLDLIELQVSGDVASDMPGGSDLPDDREAGTPEPAESPVGEERPDPAGSTQELS
jgi:hypothetical protein